MFRYFPLGKVNFTFAEKIEIEHSSTIWNTSIEYLKGVGPLRADLLKKELQIFTFRDLLLHFPLRHIDKTQLTRIRDITLNMDYVQTRGLLDRFEIVGSGSSRRLVAVLSDGDRMLELTWFRGIGWVEKKLTLGASYLIFGKIGSFNNRFQIIHPEMELFDPYKRQASGCLEPVYPATEKLKVRGLNGRQIGKLTSGLFQQIRPSDIEENIPAAIRQRLRLVDRYNAFHDIHFPADEQAHRQALRRLKFEEFFIAQIRLNLIRLRRHHYSQGVVFREVGNLFHTFYRDRLPFELTGAQKRVLREIRQDTAKGFQMNRLLQGDVGSGKTMVALLSMLLAADNGFQSCLMAPTEILAQQHYAGLKTLLSGLPIHIALLTGSVKTAQRKEILSGLANQEIQILIGTHAIIEKKVSFAKLGLAIVDEQHRFGVAQRASLWKKSPIPPHILVMTATPIPRTLAMTAYGDLDYSIMDELPAGRRPVITVHRNEMARPSVMDFVRQQIDIGRQAYFIYPLIEESEKLSYENLMQGYEEVKSYFPDSRYQISMLHGRQPSEQKEVNMQRFVNNETQIMVSTTVIEVGVNVPNATVMVIESAEKFGLSQLHQLRGRVGRGAEQSYCVLITGRKTGEDAIKRINVMCETNDGFLISEKDLELRGPGDIEGTRQSGDLNFKLASIVEDKNILEIAKVEAESILQVDPQLTSLSNACLRQHLEKEGYHSDWSHIS